MRFQGVCIMRACGCGCGRQLVVRHLVHAGVGGHADEGFLHARHACQVVQGFVQFPVIQRVDRVTAVRVTLHATATRWVPTAAAVEAAAAAATNVVWSNLTLVVRRPLVVTVLRVIRGVDWRVIRGVDWGVVRGVDWRVNEAWRVGSRWKLAAVVNRCVSAAPSASWCIRLLRRQRLVLPSTWRAPHN